MSANCGCSFSFVLWSIWGFLLCSPSWDCQSQAKLGILITARQVLLSVTKAYSHFTLWRIILKSNIFIHRSQANRSASVYFRGGKFFWLEGHFRNWVSNWYYLLWATSPHTHHQGWWTEQASRVSMDTSWDLWGQGVLGGSDGMGLHVGEVLCLGAGRAGKGQGRATICSLNSTQQTYNYPSTFRTPLPEHLSFLLAKGLWKAIRNASLHHCPCTWRVVNYRHQ